MTALEQAVREVLGQHCGCCQGQGGCTPCTPQARELAERITQIEQAYLERLDVIADVFHDVDVRCMAVDGPVTPTSQEINEADLKRIWHAVKPNKRPSVLAAFTAPRGGDQQ